MKTLLGYWLLQHLKKKKKALVLQVFNDACSPQKCTTEFTVSLVRDGMSFAFGNLENVPENKHSLFSLLQLVNELDTANMKTLRGHTFFYGKLSAFRISFSKNNQMLQIISERVENNFT